VTLRREAVYVRPVAFRGCCGLCPNLGPRYARLHTLKLSPSGAFRTMSPPYSVLITLSGPITGPDSRHVSNRIIVCRSRSARLRDALIFCSELRGYLHAQQLMGESWLVDWPRVVFSRESCVQVSMGYGILFRTSVMRSM